VNGIVVDPRDASALAEAMHRAADPDVSRTLRDGVQRTSAVLRPEAVAKVVLGAIGQVWEPRRAEGEAGEGPESSTPDQRGA
jgi:hypothetical protein